MSLVNRQNNLFASEDWKIAYKAYSEINFRAYDYDSIRTSLVEYVRTNFPENFNDYIESSEFIAIIELLAYLSQSLAFRMDLNSRENFLETAERRDNVFKLARMLGYNPKRNITSSGLMKITAVRTTQPLNDSLGNPLNNRTIYWDDANNPQSYEQFIAILNAAMTSSNRFTAPSKTGMVGGVSSELYQLSTPIGAPLAYNFTLNINGSPKDFNAVNPDLVDNGYFFERHPDPTNLFNLIYRNDGLGLSSTNTGFFVMFKQGMLDFRDFNYTAPIENRTEDVAIPNINETDVYLQEINSNGLVLNKWEKIPNTIGQTLNYNSVSLGTKNLYAVDNINNGGVRIKYPDGNFGNIPYGIFRFWFRTSDPTRYAIQPEDARNVNISIPYEDARGREQSLTLTFRLERRVNNSLPPESLDAIKERAPQIYYSQNRMISAQDYNVFPLSQSNNITKLKALNRTHAGHSRYIDINDPTGTFHNLDTFAKDAILYVEDRNTTRSIIVNANNTPVEIVASVIPEYLKDQRLNNFVYYGLRNRWTNYRTNYFQTLVDSDGTSLNIRWKPLPLMAKSKTGYMTESFSTSGETVVMLNTDSRTKVFKDSNFVKFVNSNNLDDYKWVRIISVDNNGQLTSGLATSTGPWKLSEEINDGWFAEEVIASLRKVFNTSETAAIRSEISNKKTFGLGYNVKQDYWYVIANKDLNKTADFAPDYAENTSGTGLDSSWLLLFEYNPINISSYRYNVTVRGQDYVVQSVNDLKFYNIKNVKVVDSTNKSSMDTITFNTLNTKPGSNEIVEWFSRSSVNYWRNTSTGSLHIPVNYSTNIPLRTRNTKWNDIEVSWNSNFGMFDPTGSGSGNATVILNNIVAENRYVEEAIVPLNSYFDDGTQSSLTTNVTIANNSGQLSRIPSTITIPFNNTTFGTNILDNNGNITYRQYNVNGTGLEIFHGNATCYSYGATGTSYSSNTALAGRLYLANANVTAQTGNLIYSGLENNIYHLSSDSTKTISRDRMILNYLNNKEQLDKDIVWEVVDVYKYADGYTDPRKVVVAPKDSDSDMVPDRPLQFYEFVDTDDLQLFEYYTDFDGYTYDRPVSGVILDYRKENSITVNFTGDTISPGSYTNLTTLSDVNWIIVKNLAVAQSYLENNLGKAGGIKVYSIAQDTCYVLTPSSTNLNIVRAVESNDFFVKTGRGPTQNTASITQDDCIIRWQHVAPNDVRIDPSISNVVEMIILTTSYYNEVLAYQTQPMGRALPKEPTSAELGVEFQGLNEYKAASDSIVFRSAKFKPLFGSSAEAEYQARFRVVKISNQLSDNELKTRIIAAFNSYFDVTNWEFGETFYFTELSSYVHQQLGSGIGSIVILPKNTSGKFGDLFQVKAEPNELFLNTATVEDIEIVDKINSQTLRTDR
jgi:hypothetical protein